MKTHVTRNPVGSGGLTMSRAEFLRTLGLGAAGVAGTLAGFGGVALAASKPTAPPNEVDVYPTGQFPYDVEEVRAAVNGGIGPSQTMYPGGGTVRLKATLPGTNMPMYFNFGFGDTSGARGTVEITKDVIIVGERIKATSITFPNGQVPDRDFTPDRTIIYGGKRPFACKWDNPEATTLAVRNIYFAFPSLAAVKVGKTAGLEVSDCVIYDLSAAVQDGPAPIPGRSRLPSKPQVSFSRSFSGNSASLTTGSGGWLPPLGTTPQSTAGSSCRPHA